MRTYPSIFLLAALVALAGCAAPADKKSCDPPQIQRELGYAPSGCEQTS